MSGTPGQVGDDEVAEWVGQHYRLHFDSLNDEQRQHWRERFDEVHEKRTTETNEGFVVRLMRFAKSGPLMQAFVIQALDQYSKAVAAAPIDESSSPFISPEAWKACAVELQAELTERLK